LNFSCPQCQRRYVIADEKVAGKAVRLRCKNCQAVIALQGPPLQEEAPPEEGATRAFSLEDMERLKAAERALARPAPAAPAPVRPAAPPPASWYAMVQGQQVGPLSEEGLRAQVAAGAIGARNFLWREGLAEWKRGAELAELAHLWPAPVPAAAPARASAPVAGGSAPAPGAQAVSRQAAGAQAVSGQAVSAGAVPAHVAGQDVAGGAAWASGGAEGGPEGAAAGLARPTSQEPTQLFQHVASPRARGRRVALVVAALVLVPLLTLLGLSAAGLGPLASRDAPAPAPAAVAPPAGPDARGAPEGAAPGGAPGVPPGKPTPVQKKGKAPGSAPSGTRKAGVGGGAQAPALFASRR
jgi:predicted Zn finger-like uncharacterized protein